jgi:hypothetical protein
MEVELLEVKRKIAAVEFLLSNRRVGDPENPYIMVYEHFTIDTLQIEKHDLQTEKILLFQQQLAATQTSAGKFAFKTLLSIL